MYPLFRFASTFPQRSLLIEKKIKKSKTENLVKFCCKRAIRRLLFFFLICCSFLGGEAFLHRPRHCFECSSIFFYCLLKIHLIKVKCSVINITQQISCSHIHKTIVLFVIIPKNTIRFAK